MKIIKISLLPHWVTHANKKRIKSYTNKNILFPLNIWIKAVDRQDLCKCFVAIRPSH